MSMTVENSKTRIVAIIPTLEKGGAERVLVHLMNHLDHDRFEGFIFCLKKKGELVEQVDSRIQIVDIDYPRVYFSIFRLKKAIRKVKADVVIGWLGNVNAVLAFFKPILPRGITLLCRESSIPSLFNQYYRLPFLFNFFYRFYNRFDGIICQSQAMRDDLVENFRVNGNLIKTINNPVLIKPDPKELDPLVQRFMNEAGKLLLFVGRFSPEKQVNLLLAMLTRLDPGYRLLLVGYGPQEMEVRSAIKELGIDGRVMIINNCSNPAPYYRLADCFILASFFEGFPNVLLESNACGCPVVVYKTTGGAREIINGQNGIYLDQVESNGLAEFAKAIESVCHEKKYKNREQIAARVADQYGIRKIAGSYMEYVEEMHAKKKKQIA